MGNCHVNRGKRKIVYEEMTNLYPWSMSQKLPTGDFHEIEFAKELKETYSKQIYGFQIIINVDTY